MEPIPMIILATYLGSGVAYAYIIALRLHFELDTELTWGLLIVSIVFLPFTLLIWPMKVTMRIAEALWEWLDKPVRKS